MAEKWDRMLRSVEEQDIALMDADLHEDFMFVADYTLETREDWLATTKAEIRSGEFKFSQPKLLLETDDMVVFEDVREIDGQKTKHINTTYYKDGKCWRSMINRVPIL